jgi:hypothetical protein
MTDPIPPQAALLNTLCAVNLSQAIYVAARLQVADSLVDGPREVTDLAARLDVHAPSLRRLLRSLAGVGIFTEVEPGVVGNTPQSDTLRADAPGSMRDLVLWVGDEAHWRTWTGLLTSVRTGEPAWEGVHGTDIFEYLTTGDPDLGAVFQRAMTSFASAVTPLIATTYTYPSEGVVVDVGGGYGHVLDAILLATPTARGVLFELPAVADAARPVVAATDTGDRVDVVGGDFLTGPIPAGDVYVLKHVLHDWDDNSARVILGNIREAMAPDARIVIAETVLPDGDTPHFGKTEDLEMLVMAGGVERSESEFRALAESADLEVARIIATPSLISLVELTTPQR